MIEVVTIGSGLVAVGGFFIAVSIIYATMFDLELFGLGVLMAIVGCLVLHYKDTANELWNIHVKDEVEVVEEVDEKTERFPKYENKAYERVEGKYYIIPEGK